VDAVIEGTVQRSGKSRPVTAQLIHDKQTFICGLRPTSVTLKMFLVMQSALAQAIVSEIRVFT